MKESILKTLDQLAIIYSDHVRENISRNEMIEILINGEFRNIMNNIVKEIN
jgi:hypothetical protein